MEISKVTNLISKVTEIDEEHRYIHEFSITFSKVLLQKSITAIQEPSVCVLLQQGFVRDLYYLSCADQQIDIGWISIVFFCKGGQMSHCSWKKYFFGTPIIKHHKSY